MQVCNIVQEEGRGSEGAYHGFCGHEGSSDHGVEVRSADGPKCEDQQRQQHLQCRWTPIDTFNR